MQQWLNIVVHDGADEGPDMNNVEYAYELLWYLGESIPDVKYYAWKFLPSWKVARGDVKSIEGGMRSLAFQVQNPGAIAASNVRDSDALVDGNVNLRIKVVAQLMSPNPILEHEPTRTSALP